MAEVGQQILIGKKTYTVKVVERGEVGLEDEDGGAHVFPEEIFDAASMGQKAFVVNKELLDRSKMYRLLMEEALCNVYVQYYDSIAFTIQCGFSMEESEKRHAEIIAFFNKALEGSVEDHEFLDAFFRERKKRWMDS